MNINSLFESRNKTFSNLFKTSIYLSRLLRENVCILHIDNKLERVHFLTESNKILEANYFINEEKVVLSRINIMDVSEYLSEDKYNEIISTNISSLLDSSRTNTYSKLNENFTSLLDTMSSRLKLEEVKKKIDSKLETIALASIDPNIYKKLLEAKSLIVAEIPKVLKQHPEIKQKLLENVKLANAISSAFSYNKTVDLKSLQGKSHVFLKEDFETPIFNLICIQELLKKEILEAKDNLYSSWAYSDKISTLIENINDEKQFSKALHDALIEYPYFALLNKKNIEELVESYYATSQTQTKKNINEVSQKIFLKKKEFKNQLLSLLQEKYGISVAQLKDTPSLKNLSKLQYGILVTLVEKMENGVARDVLIATAKEIKFKNGVDLLDINSYLAEVFIESNTLPALQENIVRYLNIPALKKEIESMKAALTLAVGGDSSMGGGMDQQMPGNGVRPEDNDQIGGGMDNQDPNGQPQDQMQAGQEAGGAMDGEMGDEMGGDVEPGEEPPMPEGEVSRGEIMSTLKHLEAMIAKLGLDTDVYPEDELEGSDDIEQMGSERDRIPEEEISKPKGKGGIPQEEEGESDDEEDDEENYER